MRDFVYYTPTKVYFGKGKENDIGKICDEYGYRKVFIVYGGQSAVKSGLIERVEKSLAEADIICDKAGGVKANPVISKTREIIKQANIFDPDLILAVGGGSVIDTAKTVGYGVAMPGVDVWDYFSKKAKITKSVPIAAILTIAAAGSEGSGDSVITKEDGMLKRGASGDAIRPKFSIMNPELLYTLPSYQTACGATDIMAHVFERYFTNTEEVEITDRLCEAVLLTMIKETPRLIKDPKNYEARANVMWAGTVAHTNICGVGRSQDWNSHGIEHELSALYDCAHGAGLAVIMPAWMTHVYKHNVMRFAQAAVRVWGCQMNFENPEATCLEGISCFRKFLKSIGMPINFKELGADVSDIPYMVENMGINGTTGGFMPLTPEDVKQIYLLASEAEI